MMGAAELQASHDGTTRAASWWRAWWPEIAIVALAALVRFWRLDYHSFWFDEAVSLDWAEDNPAFIWANTFPLLNDKHPPAYYLLLHYWQKGLALFGLEHSDVALRSLGAILGVLTVLGVLLLARRLSGRATGLLAGALVALSPVLVWYSQELRMFQPATTGVVWAAYCLARGWQGATIARRLGWWIGLIAAFTFALYGYLFSAFLLPAAGLTLLGLWWLATRPAESDPAAPPLRRFLEGSAALAITGALFLPLAINAWLVNDSEGQPGQAFMNFAATLARQVHIFTVWRAGWPEWWVTAALVFFGLLVAAGLVWSVWATAPGTQRHDRLWLWLWIGTPLL
ncbi:MAG: glycosyltransferase family 39 protein, partial [Caldilineaceae bacterium]|nr:glycosyltransferase family 39 protein [Caldilineaceae bacterium]